MVNNRIIRHVKSPLFTTLTYIMAFKEDTLSITRMAIHDGHAHIETYHVNKEEEE